MTTTARQIILRTAAAVISAGFAIAAQAAGLGPLNMQSSLGQPLAAEIEVTNLMPGEFDELKANIAGLAAYEDRKLRYLNVFRQVQIEVTRRPDGRPILKLSSNPAINEPAIDLLVEMSWPTGKVTQKYSVLLDPAK